MVAAAADGQHDYSADALVEEEEMHSSPQKCCNMQCAMAAELAADACWNEVAYEVYGGDGSRRWVKRRCNSCCRRLDCCTIDAAADSNCD